MKRIILSLFIVLLATTVSGQVCEGLNVLTLRVGDNGVSNPDTGTPTLSLAYEYELIEDAFDIETLCLGAGAHVGYRYYRRSGQYSAFYFAYSNIMYSLRAIAHYDILGQLLGMHSDHVDTYAVVSLGVEHSHRDYYDKMIGKIALSQEGEVKVPSAWSRRLMPGLQVGCRYWFTPNVGAVAEVGFDGFSFFNGGLSVCF